MTKLVNHAIVKLTRLVNHAIVKLTNLVNHVIVKLTKLVNHIAGTNIIHNILKNQEPASPAGLGKKKEGMP